MKKLLIAIILLFTIYFSNAYILKFAWNPNSETNIVKYRLTYGVTNKFTNELDILGRETTNTTILLYSTNHYFFLLQAVTDIGSDSEAAGPLFSPIILSPTEFRIIGIQVSTNLSSWQNLIQFINYSSKTNLVEFYKLTIR